MGHPTTADLKVSVSKLDLGQLQLGEWAVVTGNASMLRGFVSFGKSVHIILFKARSLDIADGREGGRAEEERDTLSSVTILSASVSHPWKSGQLWHLSSSCCWGDEGTNIQPWTALVEYVVTSTMEGSCFHSSLFVWEQGYSKVSPPDFMTRYILKTFSHTLAEIEGIPLLLMANRNAPLSLSCH